MKIAKVLVALPLVLFASPALAETWIAVATDSESLETDVDKDSIRRGSDGLVYFTDYDDDSGKTNVAVDCQGRLLYSIRFEDSDQDISDWRDHGQAVKAGSVGEAELQYACANAG